MSGSYEGIQLKGLGDREPKKGGLPEGLKDLLANALKDSGENVQRAKCLEFALSLENMSEPDQAIAAAKKFHDYIMGEEK